jgi:hypothetical protein
MSKNRETNVKMFDEDREGPGIILGCEETTAAR